MFSRWLRTEHGCRVQNQTLASWNREHTSSWSLKASRGTQSSLGSSPTLASDLTQLLSSWPQDGSATANICGLQMRKRSAKHRHQLFQKPHPGYAHVIGCREGWDMRVFSWDLGTLDRIGALVRKKNTEAALGPCVLLNVVLGSSVTSVEQTDLSSTSGGCTGGPRCSSRPTVP